SRCCWCLLNLEKASSAGLYFSPDFDRGILFYPHIERNAVPVSKGCTCFVGEFSIQKNHPYSMPTKLFHEPL
ncbi:TPA: hypothetical protein ACT9GV_003158, partial [Legionella pneumophila]